MNEVLTMAVSTVAVKTLVDVVCNYYIYLYILHKIEYGKEKINKDYLFCLW